MDIALFLPSLRGGGAERVMLTLAKGFVERGLTVDLVLNKAEGSYLSELPEGVRVIDLGASRLLTGIPRLARYLRQERPTVLLSAMKHANVTALIARKLSRTKVPVVVSEHNNASISLSLSRGFKSQILRALMRITYPSAKKIIAVSKGVAVDLVDLLSLDPARVTTVCNPIVNQVLLAKAEKPIDHPWFSPGAPPVVMGAGRLSAQKDFKTLLQAFAIVRHQRPVKLLILGEGDDRENLESMIARLGLKNDVSIPGFVDNPFQYMKHASVFVLSSRWEGFGNVLVEAMACGTPVVSTDCPSGPAEILGDGKWGRLVPVGDAEALAGGILGTLEHHERSPQTRAMEFGVERAVESYISALLPETHRSLEIINKQVAAKSERL